MNEKSFEFLTRMSPGTEGFKTQTPTSAKGAITDVLVPKLPPIMNFKER